MLAAGVAAMSALREWEGWRRRGLARAVIVFIELVVIVLVVRHDDSEARSACA